MLKNVLTDRATATPPPRLNLDAVVEAGESRVRRRRALMVAASTATVLGLALGGSALTDVGADPAPDQLSPAAPAFADRLLTYAVGSTIFYGDREVDVAPYQVSTFVQTRDGFVFTDRAGEIRFSDGRTVVPVGRTNQPYGRLLAADPNGSYVGWVDTEAKPAPEFVVYDTDTRAEVVRTSEGNTPEASSAGEFALPTIAAIDGDVAYWHSEAGTTAWNVGSNTGAAIAPNTDSRWLVDVADGKLVHRAGQSVVVSADPAAAEPAFPASFAELSPHARYLATDVSDELRVFDVSSGAQVTPPHPGHPFIAVTSWLDDDSFVALGIPAGNTPAQPVDLLTCSVTAGECTVANAGVATVKELAVPIGERIGD